MSNSPKFDLNVVKVLEHWDVPDAIREIIANALDEQKLTRSQEIKIFEDKQGWHIRDFGRGLHYRHLTQNENQEKLDHSDLVVGKFGVGLKDALATLHRRGIAIRIRSPHGDMTLGVAQKAGFSDIRTLHAIVAKPKTPIAKGTDAVLRGVKKIDIDRAKDFFLVFSGEEVLGETRYGQVLRRGKQVSRIYINGVRVAEEETFLFSYNITSQTQAMRKALNRERTHVSRSAYADRVKSILLNCHSEKVAELLVEDLIGLQRGTARDEVKWLDVAIHACKQLNALQKVVFVSALELQNAADLVDHARGEGYRILIVPDNVRDKLSGLTDLLGNPVLDLNEFRHQWNDSFQFTFVDESQLTPQEREVFGQTKTILKLAGGKPPVVREIKISETMRLDTYQEALGLWETGSRCVIIKRTQLRNLTEYAATLLHEIAHARSGADDITRDFEHALTQLLGIEANSALVKAR